MKHKIICFFFTLAIAPVFCSAQITPAQDDTPIKVKTVLLNIPVIVSDRNNRNLVGLQKDDFRIVIDGKEQAIDYFSDLEGPMTVAILIDTSGSIGDFLSDIVKDAKAFVKQMTPNDEGMVVTFGDEVKVLQKLTNKQDSIRGGVVAAEQPNGGRAMMNEALIRVITKDFAERKGRKAVIVLTDGGEINMRTWAGLLDTLVETDTVVYPIFYQTFPLIRSKKNPRFLAKEWEGKSITMNELVKLPPVSYLHTLAVATGGRVYAAEASNFAHAFEQISGELRKQYVIGFYPDVYEADRQNKISISVQRDGAVVRTKGTIRLKPKSSEVKKYTRDPSIYR